MKKIGRIKIIGCSNRPKLQKFLNLILNQNQEIVSQLEQIIHTPNTVISSTNNQVAAASSVIKEGTSSVGN